ncbi:Z1 domain-containing protein [Streptacidiphilus jiangxiensis]|uniref:Z1 domain-containing protein n=1 Tax=Streptacidiphilus jiangxiensis TaxID=235985 RepID=A0A1H7RGM7_STRJI|nr:Z1 domain-containing protein [Streptacidiphilus jiangxiensis]SEL58477.1 Z1 domain-containing protein [Streptacidiphilus jiangxiensis]
MSDELDQMYDTFKALLESFTPAEAVKRLELIGVQPENIERIRGRHEEAMLAIREMERPLSVVQDNRDTWYTGPQPRDKFWPAVRTLLEKDGWSKSSLEGLDRSSTRVVSLLEHPKQRHFDTRGLVVGFVQSGKTTNFTSVIAKAADRKYKLFIVLAGIHNGLRRQTQARLIQQLVDPNPTMWSQITGLDADFTPKDNPASFFGNSNRTHVLCVVKKNATVLRKLAKWLQGAADYLQDAPALIIDDEADQATVATKSINPLILDIMGSLPRCAYIGYTASPFANLLIDPAADDLYPKDFVVNLDKPEGHFGTEVLFGRYALEDENPSDVDDGYDMIRSVPLEDLECVRPETKQDAEGFEPLITDTLREAVEYFLLVTAARRVRGTGNPHSTMLIHTSVNTAVHNSFERPLKQLLRRAAEQLQDPAAVKRLRFLWERETAKVAAVEFGETKVEFEDLRAELPGVLESCRVIMDNSSSEVRLDYEMGPVVAIAVGGNTLSRGLTLEGLSVSYFVRSVSAYDTLLQMGRWFGFRKGYADLPRIWMTDELSEWFRHLATVETEMRRDIELYMTQDVTPLTFAVRVRTHPSLRVTAAAKMKDAVTAASSFGGQRVQTHYFSTDKDWLRRNTQAAKELVESARKHALKVEERPEDGRYVLRDVPHDLVLEFLAQYRVHEKAPEHDTDLLAGYIRKRARNGSLLRWNVAVVGNPVGKGPGAFAFAPGVEVGRVVRARLDVPNPTPDLADIKTLMSRRDAAVDLEGEGAGLDENAIRAERNRQLPEHGLLVLYPIDALSEPAPSRNRRAPLAAEDHVVGVGLVFPDAVGGDSTVEKYISANLSGVRIEDEDLSALEAE